MLIIISSLLDDHLLSIGLIKFSYDITLDDLDNGGELKEINGQKGYLLNDDGDYAFVYPANKNIAVMLMAENQSLFEQIIV